MISISTGFPSFPLVSPGFWGLLPTGGEGGGEGGNVCGAGLLFEGGNGVVVVVVCFVRLSLLFGSL